MRNAKLLLAASGLALLTTGCCSTNSTACNQPQQPGFFARMKNCMCGEQATPVSYMGAPIVTPGAPTGCGPSIGPAGTDPNNQYIPNPRIYEKSAPNTPYNPDDKSMSRMPAKPISEVKLPKDPTTAQPIPSLPSSVNE